MTRIILTAELIEEEEGGYTVYCPELDVYIQGDDVEDALKNLQEAAELHIEEIGIENLKLKKIERKTFPVPIHTAKILKQDTLKGILRKADISIDHLNKLLKK